MAKILKVQDGDVLSAYKAWAIQGAISINIWKSQFPEVWQDAGGETATYGGRSYFGGRARIDSTTDADDLALLDAAGVDDEGLTQIDDILGTSGIDYVYLEMKPRSVYTKEQLTWFLREVLEPSMGSVTLTLVYPTIDAPHTKRDKLDPSLQVCPLSTDTPPDVWETSYHTDDALNRALSSIFMLTNVFEDHGTVVYSNVGATTEAVVTVVDWQWLDTGSVVDDIYNAIYISDVTDEDNPYRKDCPNGEVVTEISENQAGDLWELTSPLYYDVDDDTGVFIPAYERDYIDGLIIMRDGKFWIDTLLWKDEVPLTTLVVIGGLLGFGYMKDDANWFQTIIKIVTGFFAATLHMVNTFVKIVVDPLMDLLVSMGIVTPEWADKIGNFLTKIISVVVLAVITAGIGAVASGTALTLESAISAILSNFSEFVLGDLSLIAKVGMEGYTALTVDEFKVDKDPTEAQEDEGFMMMSDDDMSPSDAMDQWFMSMGDSEATMNLF